MLSELLRIDPICLHSTPTIRYAAEASIELLTASICHLMWEFEYLKSHMRLQDVGLPDKHRFPMRKYRLTREALQADTSMQDIIETREVIIHSPS